MEAGFSKEGMFLVRPFITVPNTNIQKWGNEYFLFKNTNREHIEQMCSNSDKNRVFKIDGGVLFDRYGVKYINTEMPCNHSNYWITTMIGHGYNLHKGALIKRHPHSQSCIFSMAYNKKGIKLFEATLILEPGDKLVIASKENVFDPQNNPFLTEWKPIG